MAPETLRPGASGTRDTSTTRASRARRGRSTSGSTSRRPTARRSTRSGREVCISRAAARSSVADGDVAFGYWHVVPAVKHHERVAKHQLLGHVEAPWLHVHFAEHRAASRIAIRCGRVRSQPWRDSTAAEGDEDRALPRRPRPPPGGDRRAGRRDRRGAPAAAARGASAVERPAGDAGAGALACPPGRRTVRPWHTPIDLTKASCRRTSSGGSTPRERGRTSRASPGLYRFFLAHTWSTRLLPDGGYRLEVEASDLYGNKGGSRSRSRSRTTSSPGSARPTFRGRRHDGPALSPGSCGHRSRAGIVVSNPFLAVVATVCRWFASSPASTCQRATSVAPFQLAETTSFPSSARDATSAGRSAGCPLHGNRNTR